MMRRMLWVCAVALVVAGYGALVAPAAQTVAETEQHAHALYDEANADDGAVRRSTQLRRVQDRVEADVRMLGTEPSRGAVTARALRLFNDEGKRFRVEVRSVTPAAVPAASAMDDGGVAGVDWNLTLHGHFRDIVAFLADVPRHDVLLDVHDIELAATRTDTADSPYLDVTLHATLDRLTRLSFSEDAHVPGSSR